MFKCYGCDNSFVQKGNLTRHITICKSKIDIKINDLLIDQDDKINKLNIELVEKTELIKRLNSYGNTNFNNINGNNNNVTNCINNDINMKIVINVNPVTKLNIDYIDHSKMRILIEAYDKNMESRTSQNLNLLLGNYITEIICNPNHPENHAIKYIKRKPPTFSALTEDCDGESVTIIRGLKDTCELVSDPILDHLKLKLRRFIQKYKKDDNPDFDYGLYDTGIDQLRDELKKGAVKRALSSVLQNDILNTIEMKFECNSK